MGIKILRQSEPGQRLEPAAAPALSDAALAERRRRERIKRLVKSPFGRGRVRMRRGRLRKMRAKNRKKKFVFGSHYRHESGHFEAGHHTRYYHATKGWRRRGTAKAAWIFGATLMNWLLLRLDLIEATIAGDTDRIKEVQSAFKRTLQTP